MIKENIMQEAFRKAVQEGTNKDKEQIKEFFNGGLKSINVSKENPIKDGTIKLAFKEGKIATDKIKSAVKSISGKYAEAIDNLKDK